jgi:uncharacterized protein involved in copper resistance
MINPRQLAPLLLALALGSMPLLAQPAPQDKTAEPARPAPEKTAPVPQVPAAREQAQKSTPPKSGRDSPFDYQSSEEISEDAPVSFPVDI